MFLFKKSYDQPNETHYAHVWSLCAQSWIVPATAVFTAWPVLRCMKGRSATMWSPKAAGAVWEAIVQEWVVTWVRYRKNISYGLLLNIGHYLLMIHKKESPQLMISWHLSKDPTMLLWRLTERSSINPSMNHRIMVVSTRWQQAPHLQNYVAFLLLCVSETTSILLYWLWWLKVSSTYILSPRSLPIEEEESHEPDAGKIILFLLRLTGLKIRFYGAVVVRCDSAVRTASI